MISFFILLLVVGFLFYFSIFSSFFFMDDFYFLSSFRVSGLGEFFSIFKPVAGIPYRPVSQQVFFFSLQKVFGLNPLPFHLVVFFVHVLNSFLVYKLGLYFSKSSFKAKLSGLLYLAASLHFVGLYSITGSYVVFGILFFLLSFIFWFKFEKEGKLFFYILSFLFFFLGVFASEIVAVLPLLIFFFSKFRKKVFKLFSYLLPFLLPIGLNLLINNLWAGAPKTKAFSFDLRAFPSLVRWYFLRALGLPEGIKNGPRSLKFLIYGIFVLLVFVLFVGFLKYVRSFLQKSGENRKRELFLLLRYIAWILAACLPFLFMPHHLNPIYFSLSFIGFLFFLQKVLGKGLFLLYGFLFLVLSFLGIRLLLNTHWTVRRSNLSKRLINQVGQVNKGKGAVELLFPSKADLEEAEITLLKDKGLKLFFGEDIKVNYRVEK